MAGSTLLGRDAGISVIGSARTRIVGNSVRQGFTGIRFSSDGGWIAGNEVTALVDGVVVDGSANRVIGNQAAGAGIANIAVLAGSGNVVARTQTGPTSPGVLGSDGIFVGSAANETVVRRNLATGNGDDGIDTESPSTRLLSNTANDNPDLGIEAVPGVFAGGNRASGNGNPLQCLNVFCR